MSTDITAFKDLRCNAAKLFAQTMVVVDDDARQKSETDDPPPIPKLHVPSRKTLSANMGDGATEKHTEGEEPGEHILNAKLLIDNAMELGLICSVLRPKERENFRKRVAKVAQVADIVCLDWEIHSDGGDAASKIIRDILREDAKQKGRLRLITIYTADSMNGEVIISKVFDELPKGLKSRHGFKKDSLKIVSENGARIICLFKDGVRLPAPMDENQVSESQLPERLQTEFSELSEGLLSNVALSAIASIRSSTHHILSKFTGQMDGPFFHHRAMLDNPEDADEYAVDIVLSELKSAVNKQQVAAIHAGPEAIKARISAIAGDKEELKLHYERSGQSKAFNVAVETTIKMVTNGLTPVLSRISGSDKPSDSSFKENFSTLFSDSKETARLQMDQFAVLTSVRAHPKSHLYDSSQLTPRLGLGTIVRDQDKTYLMCLQASCDSIHIKDKRAFLFVELCESDKSSQHVVPISRQIKSLGFIGLSIRESYRAVRSIDFSPSPEAGAINAKRFRYRSGFYFEDINKNRYRWIADLKRRRALRIVQDLGQHMGRLGFDEFEPYRYQNKKNRRS